ncbi:flagellar FlbD family protein [Candidatus Epulonipiscium viviparus]|uniref:flagellar FlbD family protein n=1 Tax=Candidatus Epulonipiscium viviparus TaxID=420336 RepID=UPI00016C0DB9|nr:flagellar FlbD family protein [Candidatus Epulopiscium viviparus]
MVTVTRLNGKKFIINAELIETMEETPDTVITIRDGKKFVVIESIENLIDQIITYKRSWFLLERFDNPNTL